jgi:hypothetical protein
MFADPSRAKQMSWNKRAALGFGAACASLLLVTGHATGQDVKYFKCNNSFKEEKFIELYLRNDKIGARLGERVDRYLASCSFGEGLTFKERISEKDVIVYSGSYEVCSQGQIMLFNKRSQRMILINAFTFEQKSFQCEPTEEYGK